MSAPAATTLTMIVDGYSWETRNLANGRSLKSDAVAAGGHSWRIAFYPNGRLASTTDSVSVYLLLDDDAAATEVHVELRFTLNEPAGYEAAPPPPRFVSPKVAGAMGGGRQRTLGCEHFVSREDLKKLYFIDFTIRCDLTVFPNAGKPAPPPRSISGLPEDLGRLLETKRGADVHFEVGGKVFAAHKLVLAARSPVFMADFFGPAKEKAVGGYIRICDIHPDAFQALLHYIYTDTLPATTAANAPESKAAAVLAQDLLVAADKYNLKDLKSLTENKLCRHSIGVSTVLPMLALAERHQCWKLKKKCLEFVASRRNTRVLMAATDDVENLARSCPSVVREVLAEILDAREATPSNPVMVSVDASFKFFALIFILLFGVWALVYLCCFV